MVGEIRTVRLDWFVFVSKPNGENADGLPQGMMGWWVWGRRVEEGQGGGEKVQGNWTRTRLQRLCVCTSRTCRSSWTIPLRLYPACSGFPFLIRGLWVISLKEGESLFSSLSFQIKSSLVSQTELSVNTDKTRNGSGRGTQKGLCLLRSSTA